MKAAPVDYIIIETVGIGQSEIDIVGLADITVVVVVPEAGDEIQTMKAVNSLQDLLSGFEDDGDLSEDSRESIISWFQKQKNRSLASY